jgi:hypothetical protein
VVGAEPTHRDEPLSLKAVHQGKRPFGRHGAMELDAQHAHTERGEIERLQHGVTHTSVGGTRADALGAGTG